MKKLEDYCANYLTNRINLMTIFQIFEHALLFNCGEMIDSCKAYLSKKECEPAFRSRAFSELSQKSLISVLELDTLGVDEFNLYGYVSKICEFSNLLKNMQIFVYNIQILCINAKICTRRREVP